MRPRARRSDLETQQFGDELIVYDLATNEAHALHPTTVRVWEMSDGSRTVPEILEALGEDDAVLATVWESIDALGVAGLLEGPLPPPAGEHGVSRRTLIRNVAAAGALGMMPGLVRTIVAPAPLAAQSGGGGNTDNGNISGATGECTTGTGGGIFGGGPSAEEVAKEENCKAAEESTKAGGPGGIGVGGVGVGGPPVP